MKRGNLKKKVSSLLLAIAMTVTTLPQVSTPVHAEDELPISQFATKEQLKSFNTDDTNDKTKNPAKVYFGINQKWWIAGSQGGDSITLFDASPFTKAQVFAYSTNERDYNGTQVYSTHYGASDIKSELKTMETDVDWFSASEQGMMLATTIYTNDTKNNSTYSTTDKLYLAYGAYDDQYITVGTNQMESLNSGLRIDKSYWKSDKFWLRAPYKHSSVDALFASPRDYSVGIYGVKYWNALAPAFELNLSSVIFASAAPTASSDGKLELQDTTRNGAFTLRHKPEKELGTATISQAKESITVADIKNENTYLVVQNKNGAWSKKVTSNDLVFASDMDSSLNSLENCKVWLEITTDNITYATEFTQGSGYNVKVNIGENLIVNSGNTLQTNVSGDITDITVEVADGYYLPDNYISGITGLNGLTVAKTDNGFKISGTPTSDVNITLLAATVLPKADTPQVTISKTATSITATVTNHQENFGDIEYKWNDGNWEQNKNTLSDLQPNTTYKLVVRFTGNGFYQMSDEYNVDITTLQDGNTVILIPAKLTTTYKEGLKLSTVVLPQGWSWKNGDTSLSAGTKSYPATFDTTSLENTTDFSKVDGYDKITHKVTRNVEVEVEKADSTVIITTLSLDKKYNGNEVSNPNYTTSRSGGNVTIKWQKNTGTKETPKWEDLKLAPNEVGTYRVVVELAGNNNYNSASAALEFVISQAQNTWTDKLSSFTGWTYGETANEPSATAKYGIVEYTYSNEENGTYTSDVPTNAGKWYVKASVVGTENYTSLEAKKSFEIAKADSSIKFKNDVTLNKVYDTKEAVVTEKQIEKIGSTGTVSLTFEKKVDNEWNAVKTAIEVGTYQVTATLAGDDNHNSATSTPLEFIISKADSQVIITTSSLDKVYDGKVVSNPEYTTLGSDGEVTLKWQENTGTKDTPKWEDLTSVPSAVGTYRVVVELAGNNNYNSASAALEFVISQAKNTWIEELSSFTGWTYGKTANEPSATAKFGTVEFTYSNEENGTYTSDVPTNAGTWYVKASVAGTENYTGLESDSVPFTINKADSKVEITTSSTDKVFDEKAVNAPKYTTSGSDGKVTIKWQKNTGTAEQPKWEDLTSAPSTVGIYRVVVELQENDNYNSASAALEFVISQTKNTWTEELSIKGWTYNEMANDPTAKAQFGDVTFTYSSEENGTYTNEVPKNAGTYYVKASVAGTENYTGLEMTFQFEIAKANTTLTFEKDNIDKVYDKNAITEPSVTKTGSSSDVTFTWFFANGDDWTLLDNAPSDVGTYKVVASVREDSNYNSASIEKEFSISNADNEWTKDLTIKEWTYGETASVPSAVSKFGDVVFTYSNEENGTYTNEVPKNAGTYYVKASVTGTENYTGLEKIIEFKIVKANTTLTFEKDNIDKVYDKNTITEPSVKKTGNSNEVTFTWFISNGNSWDKLDSAPLNVGNYKVVASVREDSNYNSASIEKKFSISIADNEWIKELSINNWTYGETASDPNAETKFGDVVYTYSDSKEGTYTGNVPTSIGTYYVKASVTGTENYTGLESAPVKFEIMLKDGNTVIVVPENLNVTYKDGLKLFDVILPDGWSWVNENTVLSAGEKSYLATFDTTKLESTTDFSRVEGYDKNTHKVTRSINVKVAKADSQVNIIISSLDKAYDGNTIKEPVYTTLGSDGKVNIKWQKKSTTAKMEWEDLKSAPSTVGSYRVVVEVEENDNYNSASAALEFVISKATNTWTEELSIAGWTYDGKTNDPTAKAQFGDVTFTYSNKENGTYTNEVPKNAGTWYVKATVAETENYTGLEGTESFEIAKANSTVKITTEDMNKAYDGNKVTEPMFEKTGSTKDVAITWYQKESDDNWKELTSAPTNVGSYKVVVSVEEDENYNRASAVKTIVISKTTNDWKEALLIKGWTYGGVANKPTATTKFGTVEYTYSNEENGTYTNEVPKNAGTWYVKATVAGTENYTDLEAKKSFEIAKAEPVYDIPQGLKLKQGDALSTVELPEGFAWVEDTLVLNELGEHKIWAVFTPEDTANYQRTKIEIVVEVVPPMTPINSIPTIQVKDKTFTVNDTFDPLTDVSAFDKEDGNLTDKIKVMENTVDMTKAGTYKVVYQVEDSQKAVATKTITVTVREKAGSQNTDNEPKKEDGAQSDVETGDTTNIFLWGMISVLSALGILVIAGKKRRMRKIK